MKHFSKIVAAVLSGALIFSGCSGSNAHESGQSANVESATANNLYDLNFEEINFLDLMGSSKREVSEKFNISDYEDKEELTADMTYKNGEFGVTADFKFIDSQLNNVKFDFNTKDLSEDDIVYIYNSVYKDLAKFYGEKEESSGTYNEDGMPDKTVIRYWIMNENTVLLSRHYWNDDADKHQTLSLSYSGSMKDTNSGSYSSSCVYFVPGPSCDAASSNWGDDLQKVLLFNPNFDITFTAESVAMGKLKEPVDGFDTTVQLGFGKSKQQLCMLVYFIGSSDKSDCDRVIELYTGLVSYLSKYCGSDGKADYTDDTDLSEPGEYSVIWYTERSIVNINLNNDENNGISIHLTYGAYDEKYYS